jgi:ubiquinone/menaquinone biosynthesis C-methylase UbiE
MSDMSFRGLALWLRLREKRRDSQRWLREAGLELGQDVLDFGCGIGSFTLPAAQIVGKDGTVYALDIHPLAIEAVERRATSEKLGNIKTILSDRDTGLPDQSVDVVLLYDVLHSVSDQQALLRELHRVLRPPGLLSVVPDHMTRDQILNTMGREGLFEFQAQRGESFSFIKQADA